MPLSAAEKLARKRELNRLYREKNREQLRAKQREQYAAYYHAKRKNSRTDSRQRIAAFMSQYRQEKKEQIRQQRQQYREKNRDRIKQYRDTHTEQYHQWVLANAARLQMTKRLYREKHRNKAVHYAKEYYRANKTTFKAKSQEWYANNAYEVKNRVKQWTQANPEKAALYRARRKAKSASAPYNDFTAKQWRTMVELLNHCCVYCDRQMQRLTMDHLTPFIAGGSHTLWNILPACLSCNSRKQAGPVLQPVQPFLLLP
jgi:HNH endonuclease